MRKFAAVLVLLGCGSGGNGNAPPPPTCETTGCPAGFQCSLVTDDCEAASGSMVWMITDQCVDGLGFQVRYFDTTHGGMWPGPGQTFQTATDGGFASESLACIPGAKICFGAVLNPDDGNVFWGSGIDGVQACDACCAICGQGNPQPINLVCN